MERGSQESVWDVLWYAANFTRSSGGLESGGKKRSQPKAEVRNTSGMHSCSFYPPPFAPNSCCHNSTVFSPSHCFNYPHGWQAVRASDGRSQSPVNALQHLHALLKFKFSQTITSSSPCKHIGPNEIVPVGFLQIQDIQLCMFWQRRMQLDYELLD